MANRGSFFMQKTPDLSGNMFKSSVPLHPGQYVRETVLTPKGISVTRRREADRHQPVRRFQLPERQGWHNPRNGRAH